MKLQKDSSDKFMKKYEELATKYSQSEDLNINYSDRIDLLPDYPRTLNTLKN